MKPIFLIIVAIFITLHYIQGQQTNHYYKIVNDNSQNTYIQQRDSCCDDRIATDFVDCFFSLTVNEQKDIFKNLAPARRRELLSNFTYMDYEKFLDAYSEYDWKNLYDRLTEDEQKFWPKTVKEQLFMVKYIKKAAEKNNLFMDFAIISAGILINPIIIPAYYSYVGYGIIDANKHPFKENCLKWNFENYMKSTFEL